MEIQARAEQFNVPASLELLSARGARGVHFQDLELLFDMAMSDYRPLQGTKRFEF